MAVPVVARSVPSDHLKYSDPPPMGVGRAAPGRLRTARTALTQSAGARRIFGEALPRISAIQSGRGSRLIVPCCLPSSRCSDEPLDAAGIIVKQDGWDRGQRDSRRDTGNPRTARKGPAAVTVGSTPSAPPIVAWESNVGVAVTDVRRAELADTEFR